MCYFSLPETCWSSAGSDGLLNRSGFWWNCQSCVLESIPAYEILRNCFPLVAVQLVRLEKASLIGWTPEAIVDFRIEVVIPSFWGQKYLSRHCLPVLSNSVSAQSFSDMRGHFLVPYLETRRTICWSSCVREIVPLPTTSVDPWTSMGERMNNNSIIFIRIVQRIIWTPLSSFPHPP